jgi:Dyp-type peroxidase family
MQELGQLASKHEVVTIFQQDGATLPGARHGHEHFGFKDGISQPAVQGFVTTDPDGQPLIAPGEFVLGFPGQGPSRANGRAVPQWMFKGSFLVIRRIAQDVPGWWNQAEQLAPAAGIGAEALGAKLVGRWRDGTPLDLDPNNDPRSGADQSTSNAFDYSDDADGAKVPLFVHIRKVNPRKAAAPGPGVADQHRIIRRGIPFGDPFDPASGKDHGPDAERGLVFACYQASIPDQFSFLQRTWANNSDFPTPGAGPDPVIGPKGTCPLAETSGTPVPLSVGQFVKIEGATYSFTPSISTLQQLASGQLS